MGLGLGLPAAAVALPREHAAAVGGAVGQRAAHVVQLLLLQRAALPPPLVRVRVRVRVGLGLGLELGLGLGLGVTWPSCICSDTRAATQAAASAASLARSRSSRSPEEMTISPGPPD